MGATAAGGTALRNLLLDGEIETLGAIVEQSRTIDSNFDEPLLETLDAEEGGFAELCAQSAARIDRLEEAIQTLLQWGFAGDAPLAAIARVAEHMRGLGSWRDAVRNALGKNADQPIPLAKLAEAFNCVQLLREAGLSFNTVAQALLRDPRGDFAYVRQWAGGVKTALSRDAAERMKVDELLHVIEEPLGGEAGIEDAELEGLVGKLQDALAAPTALAPWAAYLRAKQRAADLGVGALVEVFEAHETPALESVAAYRALTCRELVASAYERFPLLNDFDGVGIDQARERFRRLDKEIIALQREKIRSDLCHANIPAGNGVGLKRDFTDLALIRNEQAKRKRHIALRDLFDRASKAIQQMKPCIMMSPLSVAAYLKPGAMTFDLIVIDEASQMPPEDAIGAPVRARQCVVVGDRQQLPPTSFFQRFEDAADMEDEEESEDLEIESILDQAHNVLLPPRKLRWHYRSRHHSLIAFSNKSFYDNGLTVFPSPVEAHEDFGVRLVQVNGQYADRHNPAEARSIGKWALEFMRNPANRDRSLGIVAVNQLQRDLINDEMERLFEIDRLASTYRERWENTLYPFVVKNLENVQGDERDVIAISTVYGRNADGRVIGNFGPISKRNGHRRLNVLFTRAREQVVLFTSLKPEDITIRDTTPRGPRTLRAYLEYALTGRLDPGKETTRAPDSDFEVAVANRLSALGYEAVPQLGVAGFFIDLAVRHPEFPGTYLIGVECDGATYHSAKSARDRDRLREEVLGHLGWKLYRVWSTDWFRDSDGETEKLRRFIEQIAGDRRAALAQATSFSAPEEPQAPGRELGNEVESITEGDQRPLHDAELDLESDAVATREPWQRRSRGNDGAVATTEPGQLAGAFNEANQLGNEDSRDDANPVDVVGLNDTVTFHFVHSPDSARTLTIVRGEAMAGDDTISAHSPVGEALLGATVGEDVEIYAPGGARTAIVDKVVKAETLAKPVVHESKAESAASDGPRTEADSQRTDAAIGGSDRQQDLRLEQPGSLRLARNRIPYRNWVQTDVPDPRETKIAEVADYLRAIIEVEGPIRVQRAFRLYANACGINRVGRTVRSELNKALYRLSKQGEVLLESEGPDDTKLSAVARVAGAPRVVIRTAGGRDFWDVPPSELAVVMQAEAAKPYADDNELYRRILEQYGVVRLTTGIHAEFDRIRARFGHAGH